jgi:hypothetical protein
MLMHNYTGTAVAGQALIVAQFAIVLQVVWRSIWQFLDAILLAAWWLGIGPAHPPRSSPSIPPVASTRCGRSSRWRRQRRRAKPATRCSARRPLRALDRMVDFAPGGIWARITINFPHFPDVTEVRPPDGPSPAGQSAATRGMRTPALSGGSIMRLHGSASAPPTDSRWRR